MPLPARCVCGGECGGELRARAVVGQQQHMRAGGHTQVWRGVWGDCGSKCGERAFIVERQHTRTGGSAGMWTQACMEVWRACLHEPLKGRFHCAKPPEISTFSHTRLLACGATTHVATAQPTARRPFGCAVAWMAARVVDAACLHVTAVAACMRSTCMHAAAAAAICACCCIVSAWRTPDGVKIEAFRNRRQIWLRAISPGLRRTAAATARSTAAVFSVFSVRSSGVCRLSPWLANIFSELRRKHGQLAPTRAYRVGAQRRAADARKVRKCIELPWEVVPRGPNGSGPLPPPPPPPPARRHPLVALPHGLLVEPPEVGVKRDHAVGVEPEPEAVALHRRVVLGHAVQCFSCRIRRCSSGVLIAEYMPSQTASTDHGLTRIAPESDGLQPTNSDTTSMEPWLGCGSSSSPTASVGVGCGMCVRGGRGGWRPGCAAAPCPRGRWPRCGVVCWKCGVVCWKCGVVCWENV
eukprot:93100-Chlamydomonas_euryale.AAC.3